MGYRDEATVPLVISSGKSVLAVDRETGRTLWTNADFPSAAGGALLVTPGRVYVAGWQQAGAIDLSSGTTVWGGASAPRGRPALMLDGDRLIVAGSGVVECRAADGRVLWAIEVPRGNSVSIAIGERTAYDDREG